MARLPLRSALRAHAHRQTGATGGGGAPTPPASTRDIFDYWQADGELGAYPPYNVATDSFDYWQADGELPAIESESK